jgi:hypothetical protein
MAHDINILTIFIYLFGITGLLVGGGHFYLGLGMFICKKKMYQKLNSINISKNKTKTLIKTLKKQIRTNLSLHQNPIDLDVFVFCYPLIPLIDNACGCQS